MRILWICGASAVGGAEHASLQITRLLQARGHTVEALCRMGSPFGQVARDAGLPIHDAPLGGSLNVAAWRAVRAAMAEAYEVTLVTTIDEWVWACLTPSGTGKVPVVLVRHMILPLSGRVRWLVNRRATAVVAVSDAVRRGLAGIRPERLHVIPVASRFPARATVPDSHERARARSALGLPHTGRWIGFFGGLEPAKGIEDVLRAAAGADRSADDVHVLIGGPRDDGGSRAQLSVRARTFGLNGRCHYLGRISQMEVALTAANVVVLATHSALGEAMPLTILEAMACGTPVAAYAVGGVPEIIGANGTAGRLVRVDDPDALEHAVAEVLADDTGGRRMAANALQRVRDHFDPERMADRWEALLAAIV